MYVCVYGVEGEHFNRRQMKKKKTKQTNCNKGIKCCMYLKRENKTVERERERESEIVRKRKSE